MKHNEGYREAAGALMYLMVGTHPDIAYTICTSAKFVETPLDTKWRALQQVIPYLIHSRDLGLVYNGTYPAAPTGFVGAGWDGD